MAIVSSRAIVNRMAIVSSTASTLASLSRRGGSTYYGSTSYLLLPPTLSLASLWPTSLPRWLVMQGREAEARRVLCWLANSSEADAAEAVAAIAASARGERRVTWRGLLDARVVPRKLLLLTPTLPLP